MNSTKKIEAQLEQAKSLLENSRFVEAEKKTEEILKEFPDKFVFKVYVLSKNKKRYYYIWQIEKVEQEGKLKD